MNATDPKTKASTPKTEPTIARAEDAPEVLDARKTLATAMIAADKAAKQLDAAEAAERAALDAENVDELVRAKGAVEIAQRAASRTKGAVEAAHNELARALSVAAHVEVRARWQLGTAEGYAKALEGAAGDLLARWHEATLASERLVDLLRQAGEAEASIARRLDELGVNRLAPAGASFEAMLRELYAAAAAHFLGDGYRGGAAAPYARSIHDEILGVLNRAAANTPRRA